MWGDNSTCRLQLCSNQYLIYYRWSIVKVLVRYAVIQLKIGLVAISHTTHDQMSDGAFNLPKVVVCINIGAI